MVDFDNEEKEEIRRKEELKHQVDDDGFVTVVNTKKKKMIGVDELSRPAKKQKSKELQNFYRFQMREKKRDRT
jgi:ribosomal RNA-processing protein 7